MNNNKSIENGGIVMFLDMYHGKYWSTSVLTSDTIILP